MSFFRDEYQWEEGRRKERGNEMNMVGVFVSLYENRRINLLKVF
jgi:hypothetical protein